MNKYKLLRGNPHTRNYIMMKFMLDKGLALFGKPLLQIGGQFREKPAFTNGENKPSEYTIEDGLHANLNYYFINISEIDNYLLYVPNGDKWMNLDAKILDGKLVPKWYGDSTYKRKTCESIFELDSRFDGIIVPTVYYGSRLGDRNILHSNISMNPESSFIKSISSSDLQVFVPEVSIGAEINCPYSYDVRTGLPFVHASEKTVEELIKITGDNSIRYYEESYDPREIDPKSLITERVAVKCIVRPGKRKIDRRG